MENISSGEDEQQQKTKQTPKTTTTTVQRHKVCTLNVPLVLGIVASGLSQLTKEGAECVGTCVCMHTRLPYKYLCMEPSLSILDSSSC